MSWYNFSLTADEVANGKHMKMQDVFSEIFFKAEGPKELALFSPKKNRGNDFLYFMHIPPKFEFIAKLFNLLYSAIPCEQPSLSELALNVGNADFAESIS